MGLIIAYILFLLNLLSIIPTMYPLYIWKLVTTGSLRRFGDRLLLKVGEVWIENNYRISRMLYGVQFEVIGEGYKNLKQDGSYMIICNHQSWSDIYIIQSVLNRKIPLIRFFIKDSLKYVPILGHAWLALDFPFVKRSSREQLKKNPELATKDLENVKKVCEKFAGMPFSILNFLEGHRRTPERVQKLLKKNPYKNLLRPHSGGISVVSTALRNSLDAFIDLTIVYPTENPSFLDLMRGKIRKLKVFVEVIPASLVPIEENEQFAPMSKKMKRWVDERWALKDDLITKEKQPK
ncbi:acetyltransferase [Leptospira meyeri]|uniref:acetyltransferase n=1 Tax=Leptospira meyeri TaxID=29508 RepID=UPI000C2A867B|nr:acetyltransferase [Leptospira meyeri]PKA22921.1 acyltransferase [Leptospira sp. mixed culture ATI2-C-A1]MCW7487600.1 acetyltransferase [Leptospira meyeri]PJZ79594.1 acyltransferase [Leptospira meyeri]PJZ96002.1 acyltransferase [Leptospira meyeri]TGL13683.1 acyltransferase [Leptospira meyeri]